MRSSWKALVVVVAAALVAPQFAMAEDVEETLKQMQDRMSQLEDKLQATNDQLEASQERVEQQQSLIEKAGLEDRSAKSGLSRFLEQTEFDGWVAASYAWNFNGPPNDKTVALGNLFGGVNSGALTAPLHRDHNTFNLDQIWFAMRKQATEESRGGFGVQMAYGRTGDILGGSGGPTGQALSGLGVSIDTVTGNGSALYIYEGYAEYLAPLMNGVNFTVGRFGTNIGYETIRQVDQPFVTRGIVWATQPIAHTGLKVSTNFTENLSLMVGAVNNISDFNFETDNEKTFIGSLAYTTEKFSASLNGLYGGDWTGLGGLLAGAPSGLARTSDSNGILNVVLKANPTDALQLFADAEWISWKNTNTDAGDTGLYGISAGGRLAITELTGFALRAEYVYWDNANGQAALMTNSTGGGADDFSQFAITGTIDHALTDQLTLKLEGRYDKAFVDGAPDNFFTCGQCAGGLGATVLPGLAGPFGLDANSKQDQVLALIELLYRF